MSSDHEQTPLIGSSRPKPPPPSSSKAPAQSPPPSYEKNDDNLTKFRKAIGINIDIDATNDDLESARNGARGIYKEIIDIQKSRNRQYIIVECLYYLAIGSQIVIGATLTALGPLSKLHSTAITVLGIINTSMAGILALLKGQGLPDRLRKDEYEMRKVQDFIEEMETRLVVGGEGTLSREELDELLQKVFVMYNAARDTAEMNRPETYGKQPEAAVQRSDDKGSVGVGKNLIAANGKGKATGGEGSS